jgi:hypothetical protein
MGVLVWIVPRSAEGKADGASIRSIGLMLGRLRRSAAIGISFHGTILIGAVSFVGDCRTGYRGLFLSISACWHLLARQTRQSTRCLRAGQTCKSNLK